MLAKISGAFLLVIGLILGIKILGDVLGFMFSVMMSIVGVLIVGGLIYFGWRLINRQQFPVEIWVVDLQRVMRFSEIGFRRLFSGLFLFLSFS